jgi:hypothetical protein
MQFQGKLFPVGFARGAPIQQKAPGSGEMRGKCGPDIDSSVGSVKSDSNLNIFTNAKYTIKITFRLSDTLINICQKMLNTAYEF